MGTPPTILQQLVDGSVRLRDRTKAIYRNAVDRYLAFVGSMNSAAWTGHSVVAWRTSLVNDGLKAQSVNLLLKGLRFASRRWSELEANPALDFARVAEFLKDDPKEKRISLTVPQARALVAACNGNAPYDIRDRAVITLMLRVGIRRGGACGALMENLAGNKLTFELKGGELHEVALDAESLSALRAWIAWLRSRGVRTGRVFRALKPSVNRNAIDIGTSLSPQRLYEIVRERAERAGIENCFPHLLRHSFVSIALVSGAEPWRIRKVTGHKRELQIDDYVTDLRSESEPVGATLPFFADWD